MGIISGSFTGATQSSFGVDVEWSAQTDVANNLSKVTVNVFRRYYSIDVGTRPCRCRINGVVQEKSIPGVKHYNSNVRQHIATFYQDVPHNADGTMPACEIYAEFNFNLTTSSGTSIKWMGAGGTVALETIPRASVFTYIMPSVTLGNVWLCKWVPASATFMYKLHYVLENWACDWWTPEIYPNTTGEYPLTDSFDLRTLAEKITGYPPNSTVTVTLHTYSGGVEIGSSQATFTVTVPENSATKPTVKISVAPKDSPIDGIYIEGRSGVSVSFDDSAYLGAWITNRSIAVNGAPYPTDGSAKLTDRGWVAVKGIVKDSRGFYGTYVENIYVHPYRKPRVTGLVCYRCKRNDRGEYVQAEDGTTLYLQATREFDSLGGNNQCRLEYCINNLNGDWTELEAGAYINENTAVVYLEGFEATSSFSVYVRAKDALDWGDYTGKLIPTADVDFHLRHGGKGAAFGGYAQEAGLLDVWWRSKFRGTVGAEAGINNVDIRELRFDTNTTVTVPAVGRGIGLVAVMGNWSGWCLYVVGNYQGKDLGSVELAERISGTLDLTFGMNNGSLEIGYPNATEPWAYGWYIRNLAW